MRQMLEKYMFSSLVYATIPVMFQVCLSLHYCIVNFTSLNISSANKHNYHHCQLRADRWLTTFQGNKIYDFTRTSTQIHVLKIEACGESVS